jgi:ribose/xylose/arabinose/galactoside ABC-type transport system permease subunit
VTPAARKSPALPAPDIASETPFAARLKRAMRRHSSLFAMPALMIAALALTVFIHPQFSDFDLQSLAMGALPLAFAAAAQTAVVISGGIDLSIGSAMAVANVLAVPRLGMEPSPTSAVCVRKNFFERFLRL